MDGWLNHWQRVATGAHVLQSLPLRRRSRSHRHVLARIRERVLTLEEHPLERPECTDPGDQA